MKIIVCVKQVPDSDEVKIDPRTGTLRRSEVPGVLNPADMAAVQTAVELAGQVRSSGREVSVTALTMGPPQAAAVLRESMACGADAGILLCDRLFAGADTWATSLTLAAAVRKFGGADLILTGRQSTDGETGHIGPQMAEHLDYCQVSGVETVRLAGQADSAGQEDSADRIEAVRRIDGREEHLSVQLPAVLAMAENRNPSGGLPIGAICEAYEKNLFVWDAKELGLSGEEIGLSGSRTVVVRTFLPEAADKGERLTGTCMQMAETLRERLEERHLLARAGQPEWRRPASQEKQPEDKPLVPLDSHTGTNGDIWVYAQMQQDGTPAPVVYELLGIGRKLAAASGKRVCAVLPGYGKRQSAGELAAGGADVVWLAEHELLGQYSADAYTDVLARLIRSGQPDIVLFGGTDEGRELAPRTAARLETGLTVDCTELTIDPESGELCQVRPAFGSRLMAEIRTKGRRPQMCTVRPGMFEKAERDGGRNGVIQEVPVSLEPRQIRTKVLETKREEQIVGLEAAKVVVAGGMGIGGTGGFELLQKLADSLGGAVGGTRAALNEGWISHDRMIGQTGTVVAPELYIACGISGAVQHMLGVTGANCIVAINTSPDAPIFETADYGIVADYREFIPVLMEELKKTQG